MKAIILAAGFGKRMKPLTDNIHKTLLEVGGITIIERIINNLVDNNITDICIVTGYQKDPLTQFITNKYKNLNLTFIDNPHYETTNNIYSLSLALNKTKTDDDIILIESDLIFDSSVIAKILKSDKKNIAVLDKFQSGMDGTVVTVKGDIITSIIPPHLQDSDFSFVNKYKTLNIYKFSKEFINQKFKKFLNYYTNVIDDNCYYELILGMLIYVQKEIIHAEILNNEKWAEIDDPNDLTLARYIFDENTRLDDLEMSFGGFWNHKITDYCFLRNMYFPNSSIFAEIKNNLENLTHNYGTTNDILNRKLSFFLLANKERLNILNGASQAFPILKEYFKNKKVLIPDPTFGEYPRVFNHCDTYSDPFEMDMAELENKSKNSELVIFVNPNNPTGSYIDTENIYDFAKRNPNKTILVDESFVDFSDGPSVMSLLEKSPIENIIILKSLSKSHGIPGIRLGFLYSCNHEFNNFVKNSLPIWNNNSIAEFFLEISLKHREAFKESLEKTRSDRGFFMEELEKCSFIEKTFPSKANFLLVSFDNKIPNIETIPKLLLSKYSIYVKNISKKISSEKFYLRIAVRTREENLHFISCLTACIKELYATKGEA